MPACTKKPYSTPGEALRALSILQRHGYPGLTGIHPCSACSAWHTTSKKPSGRRERQRSGAAKPRWTG